MVGNKYIYSLKAGNGGEGETTYKTFPDTWVTTSTIAQFCNSVNADETAVAGMAYLGELRCSDLPSTLVNVEAVVEVIDGTGTSDKTIHIVITSGNVAPHRWEYTYWNNGSSVSGWIGFQNELSVDNTTIQLNNGQLSVKGLPYLTQAPVADNTDGTLKIVVLTQEPATYYNGYDYKIVEEVV